MRHRAVVIIASSLWLAGCASSGRSPDSESFDPGSIRAAERDVIAALESPDPMAWVYMYTEDAVFLEGGSPPVEGRPALLEMARAM